MSNLSIAARRELRKEKILKNAELRKQKIFGIGVGVTELQKNDQNSADIDCTANDGVSQKDLMRDACFSKATNSSMLAKNSNTSNESKTRSDIDKLNEYLRSIPDPMLNVNKEDEIDDLIESSNSSSADYLSGVFLNEENESSYLSSENLSNSRISTGSTSIHSQTGSSFLYGTGDKRLLEDSQHALGLLDHPAAPCILAVMVSLLITYNFGSIVSNSLLIPFLIWELQRFISFYGSAKSYKDNPSILEAVLMLSGIKRDVVKKYIWISILGKEIMEDFSLYTFTIVIWHLLVGFPEEALKS